jgi:hypothetical protein
MNSWVKICLEPITLSQKKKELDISPEKHGIYSVIALIEPQKVNMISNKLF